MKHAITRNTLFILVAYIILPHSVVSQQLDNIRNEKPVTFHGSVGANFIGYNSSGIEDRMNPFMMVFTGNATLSVYGINMPFSFRFSDKKAAYTQPFNQFGLSPSYKWLTVHGGYRNIRFSDFTLAGHTFLGGGIELNPGKFRFGAIYGRFKRSTGLYENENDTVQSFTRKGYAIKLGVGSKKNYIDWIVLNIRDDSLSLIPKEGTPYAAPEQNIVSGFNSLFTLSKSLTFEAEIAASLYTTDASIPAFGDAENEPTLDKLNKLITINESSELTTAARTSLNYKSKKFNLRAEYRRIDPKYKSMGAYYFNDDMENFTLAPSFPLFKRKLYVRGSIGLQHDNLRNTKKATTTRTISSANLSFNPAPVFGIDLNYSNYSNNQKAGRLPLIDTLKLYQTTSNLSITPRLMFTGSKMNHMVLFMFNRSGLNDKNAATADYSELTATIMNLSYNLGFNENMLGIDLGLNHTLLDNFAGQNKISGFTAGISKGWFKGAVNAGFSNSIMRTDYNNEKGWLYNHQINGSYRINQHHNLRLSLYLTRQQYPEGSVSTGFNEFKGDLNYAYTF